jgi:hypothetical protein
MKRTALLAGVLAVMALPAFANSTQLARSAGVEPGLYSTAQLVQLIALQQEQGSQNDIQRILDDPRGMQLSYRLSTTTHDEGNH